MSSRLDGSNPITAAQMTLDMHHRMGGVLITNTAVVTGKFAEITALAATVVAQLVSEAPGAIQPVTDRTTNTTTAVPIPAGTTIYGRFTSIALTSGSVIAYNTP